MEEAKKARLRRADRLEEVCCTSKITYTSYRCDIGEKTGQRGHT